MLEIVILRGYNSLGLVLGLGSGVQRGTFGAGWQDWFGLIEFQNLGRTFGCKEKQGKTASKDSNKGGPTSYLQVFSNSIMANSVY